jgi:GNAT superfamily N-acetyltransferase
MPMHWTRGAFEISCDPLRVDVDVVSGFLESSYWATGIPRELVAKSLRDSICFSMFEADRQIGFARVISDRATFAYLGDVFVIDEYRGRGLAVWLMQCVVAHPELRNLRRWLLATRDAHSLYQKVGFSALRHPEFFMERHDPGVYERRP